LTIAAIGIGVGVAGTGVIVLVRTGETSGELVIVTVGSVSPHAEINQIVIRKYTKVRE
jgi:purine-nucleoside phosphorylase